MAPIHMKARETLTLAFERAKTPAFKPMPDPPSSLNHKTSPADSLSRFTVDRTLRPPPRIDGIFTLGDC